MPSVTAIDRLYEEASAIVDALRSTPEVSLQVTAEDRFRKALLLSAASYFERRVYMVVIDYVKDRSGGSILVESFVRNKAIARQYHTWFKWDERNANQFYGLFGDNFRSEMKSRVEKSDELDKSVKAFLEIGRERNKLVHDDYATFPLDKNSKRNLWLVPEGDNVCGTITCSIYGMRRTFCAHTRKRSACAHRLTGRRFARDGGNPWRKASNFWLWDKATLRDGLQWVKSDGPRRQPAWSAAGS